MGYSEDLLDHANALYQLNPGAIKAGGSQTRRFGGLLRPLSPLDYGRGE